MVRPEQIMGELAHEERGPVLWATESPSSIKLIIGDQEQRKADGPPSQTEKGSMA